MITIFDSVYIVITKLCPISRVLLPMAMLLGWAAIAPLSAGAEIFQNVASHPEENIADKNERIQKLQESIIEQKLKILHSKKRERNVAAELKAINSKLEEQRKRLKDLQQEYATQEQLFDSDQKKLLRTTVEKETFKPHVERRLAAYYQTGTVSLMNVLFTTNNLPELLTLEEYFRFLLQHDRRAITNYGSTIVELKETRITHDQKRQKLLDIMKEVSAEEKALADTQRSQETLLSQISRERSLYQQAADEIEKAANDLADTLRALRLRANPVLAASGPATPKQDTGNIPLSPRSGKEQIPEKNTPQSLPAEKKTETAPEPQPTPLPPGNSFAGRKGLLPPPVPGIILPRTTIMPDGKVTVNPGIDIVVPVNTPIKAIHDGRVITSGRMKEYGNLMIIDHGQQYYSVISRSHSFYKKEGERVRQGEVLGHTGDIAATPGKGLHFEIRHGVNPENPLEWIRLTGLTVQDR